MAWNKTRKYLFKCDHCEMILECDFQDQEDFDKIADNLLELECPCGSKSKILKN